MKIRYFVIFAIIYIALIMSYGFYITTDKYTLVNSLLFKFNFTLPIAIWLCLPAILLFIFAWFFVSLVALYHKVKHISFNRDIDKILTQIQEQMAGDKPKERIFSFNQFKVLSKVIKRLYLLPNTQSSISNNEKIDSICSSFIDIQNGVAQLKFKLNPSHPLYNQNLKNIIKNDIQKAFDILKQDLKVDLIGYTLYKDSNIQSVYDKAWDIILDNKNSKTLQKALNLNQTHLTFHIMLKIIKACLKGEVDVSKDLLLHSCKSIELNEREYLKLAIEVCKSLNENNINFWLSVFELLSKNIEQSVLSYFYILLEVGKTSEAMDLKQQYPKDDFLPISAFISLKDKGYPLLLFFDPLLYRENKLEKNNLNIENIKQIDYIKH